MLKRSLDLFANKYFLKFVIVGIISTIINYSFFYFLFRFIALNYLLSSAAGYILGVIAGFMLNKFWTYDSKSSINLNESAKYLGVYLLSLGLGLLFLKFQVEFLLINVLLANFFTIGLTTITNYLGTRFVVFKK